MKVLIILRVLALGGCPCHVWEIEHDACLLAGLASLLPPLGSSRPGGRCFRSPPRHAAYSYVLAFKHMEVARLHAIAFMG